MRKWMRDRLKRKKPEAGKGEPAPAPLQPAYFDAAPEASAPAELKSTASETPEHEAHDRQGARKNDGHKLDSREEEDSQQEDASEGLAEAPSSSSSQPSRESGPGGSPGVADPRRRRRRGRGGRGRGSSRSGAVAPSTESPAESTPDTASPAVPAAAKASLSTAPRVPKGSVILAIGLPGSGKSSWFKRHKINPLSSDMLRSLLFDDPTEQRFQDLIFSNLRSMLKARLIARRPLNYVDATNLTPHERQSWVKLGHDYGYEVQAVYFDVPLEVCLERNKRRERVVAEDVMRRMSGKLKAPTFEEGFSKITVVRVKQKE
jgi:predicted kinase